jgi:transcriptional regulator with XRE-family HTH domain
VAAKESAVNVALGEAMRSARHERGYNQEALARRSGLDRSYYGAIERGEFNVTMDTVSKVAAALALSISDLLRQARL